MQHYAFPKIGQFRSTVRAVNDKVRFAGVDENQKPIFDNSKTLPKLDFVGTPKLHGTNSSVVVSSNGDMWFQSRKNIITPEKDNAGFAMWANHTNNRKVFSGIASNVMGLLYADIDVVIYGEWCGKGVQKGVAVSELEKMFVIFGIDAIIKIGGDCIRKHLSFDDIALVVNNIPLSYNIHIINDFVDEGYYYNTIDFENPELAQNELNRITEEVEKCCPVGKCFGVEGVGEGVVWRCVTHGFESSKFWFKVKGEKHSKSKVKTLAKVDIEKFDMIKELSEHLANKERLDSIAQNVFDSLDGGHFENKNIGEFIKAVMRDIFDEESDTISESGFTGKDINKYVSGICRKYMMDKI